MSWTRGTTLDKRAAGDIPSDGEPPMDQPHLRKNIKLPHCQSSKNLPGPPLSPPLSAPIQHLNFFFFFFFALRPHLRHMEVPMLGVQSELQLPACATGIVMPDPSCICDLYHSSWQRWILNPLSEARDSTHNLMVTSQVH